jgi:ComF family protein
MQLSRSLFKNICNLFLQSSCPLCQRSTSKAICDTCERQLKQNQLGNPAEFWQGQPALFAWGWYGGILKRTIAHLKYDPQPELARPLGQWLAQAWIESGVSRSPFTVVPIPLHADKQQQRGFNQAELLAQSFCQWTGYPLQANGLERIRSTEAQFTLSASQREQNLSQAFSLGKAFQHRRPSSPVLLLDDIYTTGATIRAATQTLHRHGIRVRGVLAIAKTQKQP